MYPGHIIQCPIPSRYEYTGYTVDYTQGISSNLEARYEYTGYRIYPGHIIQHLISQPDIDIIIEYWNVSGTHYLIPHLRKPHCLGTDAVSQDRWLSVRIRELGERTRKPASAHHHHSDTRACSRIRMSEGSPQSPNVGCLKLAALIQPVRERSEKV